MSGENKTELARSHVHAPSSLPRGHLYLEVTKYSHLYLEVTKYSHLYLEVTKYSHLYLEVNTNTTPASYLGGVVLREEQPATEDDGN